MLLAVLTKEGQSTSGEASLLFNHLLNCLWTIVVFVVFISEKILPTLDVLQVL